MSDPSEFQASALPSNLSAPQHGPRPLPLFLAMLRSETAQSPERMERALQGLRAYQEAPRPAPVPPMPALAERLGAAIRDYGGDGPPVLFVPSLINPPSVLDLDGRSLLRWLAGRGHRVWLLDWGVDVAARRDLSVAGHVEELLLPLAAALPSPPALVGYCLGGTMALAAAGAMQVPVATIAAPWRFAGFPDEARAMLARLWRSTGSSAERLGALPMEALQSAFWSLDPARTVAKFEGFAALDPAGEKARSFVILEDWANDGAPVPYAAARELFDDFFARDVAGAGRWRIADTAVEPERLERPQLHIVSTRDRIVPAETAPAAGEQVPLDLGHVGMVVGSRARTALWEPLAGWLSRNASGC